VTFSAPLDIRKFLLRVGRELPAWTDMKNPVEVLRRKEAELRRLQEEVDALRLVGKLLREQTLAGKNEPQPRGKILQMP
jgi:hypothetical protein